MDLFQVLYLVAYLGIRLLPLLVSLVLAKRTSLWRWSRTSLSRILTGGVVYFDTESAITKSLLTDRAVDARRVLVTNVVTIEDFRSQALKIVDNYLKQPEDRAQTTDVRPGLPGYALHQQGDRGCSGREERP